MSIIKKLLLLLVCIVPYAFLPVASATLDQRYMNQPLIPFLFYGGSAFLPAFILAYLEPDLPGYVNIIWAFLSSSAYFAGYSWSLFHVRHEELTNLWPIEIVAATAGALVALCFGIAVGKAVAEEIGK